MGSNVVLMAVATLRPSFHKCRRREQSDLTTRETLRIGPGDTCNFKLNQFYHLPSARQPVQQCPTNSPLLAVQRRTQTNRLGRRRTAHPPPRTPRMQKRNGPGSPRASKTYAPSVQTANDLFADYINNNTGGLPRGHNSGQRRCPSRGLRRRLRTSGCAARARARSHPRSRERVPLPPLAIASPGNTSTTTTAADADAGPARET